MAGRCQQQHSHEPGHDTGSLDESLRCHWSTTPSCDCQNNHGLGGYHNTGNFAVNSGISQPHRLHCIQVLKGIVSRPPRSRGVPKSWRSEAPNRHEQQCSLSHFRFSCTLLWSQHCDPIVSFRNACQDRLRAGEQPTAELNELQVFSHQVP